MEYGKLLGRAWWIAWRYRALWVFGLFVAIFSGGIGGFPSFSSDLTDLGSSWRESPFAQPWDWLWPGTFAALFFVLGLLAFGSLLALAGVILRYLSEVALIRMVDAFEEENRQVSVGEGFRLGWSVRTLQVFLIDLAIGVPVALILGFLLVLSLSPLLLWATEKEALGLLGTVAALGALLIVSMLALSVAFVLSVLRPFFHRACALEGKGVFGSISHGVLLVRRRLGNALGVWLIVFALGLGYGFVVALSAVLLGAVALPGVAVFGVACGSIIRLLFQSNFLAIAAGMLAAALLLLATVGLPLLFLGAVFQAFRSTVWTLAYRRIKELSEL